MSGSWEDIRSREIILPLCPFGPIVYYQCMQGEAWIDPWENYVKQSYRNRFEVLSSTGKLVLEIPVKGQKGRKIPTEEIEIFDQRWQKRHLQSLRTCYGSAPFFIHYFDDLERLYSQDYKRLSAFSWASIRLVEKWLSLPPISLTKAYKKATENTMDLRQSMKPSKLLVAQPPYLQTFSDRLPFTANLSILDAVMHLGPETRSHLKQAPKSWSF